MPIALQCPCGKALRLKNELAGKKVRCPGCAKVLAVPQPTAITAKKPASPTRPAAKIPPPPVKEDDDAFNMLLEDPPSPPRSVSRIPDEMDEPTKPMRRGETTTDFTATPPKLEKKPKHETRGISFEEGWFGSFNSGAIGGILMIIIAVVWFVVGLQFDRIFFYPPILLLAGIVSIIKGLTGGD